MTKRCFGWRLSIFSNRNSYGFPRQDESLVTVLVATRRRDLISRAARRSSPSNISSELCSAIFFLEPFDTTIVVIEAAPSPPTLSDGLDDVSSVDSDRTIFCSVLNSASTLRPSSRPSLDERCISEILLKAKVALSFSSVCFSRWRAASIRALISALSCCLGPSRRSVPANDDEANNLDLASLLRFFMDAAYCASERFRCSLMYFST